MSIPDTTGLTLTELQELLGTIQTQVADIFTQQAQDDRDNRAAIGAAIDSLVALIGPADAPAGQDSIRAVRAYDALDIAAGKPAGTTMAENPQVAFSLAYEGLEILATLVLNIARVVGNN